MQDEQFTPQLGLDQLEEHNSVKNEGFIEISPVFCCFSLICAAKVVLFSMVRAILSREMN